MLVPQHGFFHPLETLRLKGICQGKIHHSLTTFGYPHVDLRSFLTGRIFQLTCGCPCSSAPWVFFFMSCSYATCRFGHYEQQHLKSNQSNRGRVASPAAWYIWIKHWVWVGACSHHHLFQAGVVGWVGRKVFFFYKKMCSKFKKKSKHLQQKRSKVVVFFKKIRTFSQKSVCFWGNGQVTQCGGTFFSQEIRATFGGQPGYSISFYCSPKASVSWDESPVVDAVLEEGCGFDSDDQDLSSNDENCKQQAARTNKRDAWKHWWIQFDLGLLTLMEEICRKPNGGCIKPCK